MFAMRRAEPPTPPKIGCAAHIRAGVSPCPVSGMGFHQAHDAVPPHVGSVHEQVTMSRLQNVSNAPDTQALPALLAVGANPAARTPRQVETIPFTKAELRRMIMEIMG